ncbi:MAG: TRAP transporter substrate-binding protein DctP [Chloroflexi bacterium]|nr:TRAP transporter substrate-binding protein DctP [Chloroflexota bacterium]
MLTIARITTMLSIILFAVVPGCTRPPAASQTLPITLKVSMFMSPTGGAAAAMKEILGQVESRSNGRLRFEYYWSGSLLTQRDTGVGLKRGLADMAWFNYLDAAGMLPLSQATIQLGVGENMWAGFKAWEEFIQLDSIKGEWTGQNMVPLWPAGAPPFIYFGVKPARTIEDLKKLRIYGQSPVPEVLTKLGITTVNIAAPEMYEALLRGIIDASFFNISNAPLYKLQEVCNYYNPDIPRWGGKYYGVAMNLDSWNRLPKDLQDILKEIDASTIMYDLYYLAELKKGLTLVEGSKMERLSSPPEVAEQINRIGVTPVQETFVKDMEARGLPGRYVMSKWIELYQKWDEAFPLEAKKRGWK